MNPQIFDSFKQISGFLTNLTNMRKGFTLLKRFIIASILRLSFLIKTFLCVDSGAVWGTGQVLFRPFLSEV